MSQKDFELKRINGIKYKKLPPRKDTDVRPGDRMGLTVEEVQQYIKRQKKCQGINQAISLGDQNDIVIKLPGTARVMLGFALNWTKVPAAQANRPSGLVTLTVNNEIMIKDVFAEFYGKDFTDEEYYFLPRPLSGKDEIVMNIKGVEWVYTLMTNFYYL